MPAPMEPETPAVNDLPERWRAEEEKFAEPEGFAALAYGVCADELEAALTAARAPHEEMARELARKALLWPLDITVVEAEEQIATMIAASLASVERTPWQRCPVTGEAHVWQCWFDGGPPDCTNPNHLLGPGPVCKDCQILRSAVSPAPVPQGETQ